MLRYNSFFFCVFLEHDSPKVTNCMPVYETSLEYSQGEPLVNFWRHYRQKDRCFYPGSSPTFCPLLKHCYLWYTGDKGWGWRVEAKPLFGERCLATQTLPEFRREARKKVCFRSENSHYRDEHLCLESRCCDDKQASKVKITPFLLCMRG